jgi:hypothetical protein
MLVLSGPALACACCTNEGQRSVATMALDSGKREEIESLRFGAMATLFTAAKAMPTASGRRPITHCSAIW